MTLRLLEEDGVPAPYGLAADETLARRAGDGSSPPTLRLYTYRSHAALVGRFQDPSHEIHLDYCAAHGVAVNRRPTGGGAILMGEDQLGIALALPGRSEETYSRARELMELFSSGLVAALAGMGVAASFRRKNDLEVSGRKIAGLGMYRDVSGGLLFHASLLLDMDIPLMLAVLRTPFEKVSAREIGAVDRRITTLRRETGARLTVDMVRPAIAAAYARELGWELKPGEYTAGERTAITDTEKGKYLTSSWVCQETRVRDSAGTARLRTPSGLLELTVCLAGERIKSAHVRGDFFASEQSVADLEGSLTWHCGTRREIENTVSAFFARHGDAFAGVGPGELIAVLSQAVSRALRGPGPSDPYGCFVSPGAPHAAA